MTKVSKIITLLAIAALWFTPAQAGMTVAPESLTFTAVQGSTNPASKPVTVTNTDGALTLTYGVVSQPNYMVTVSNNNIAIIWNVDTGNKV